MTLDIISFKEINIIANKLKHKIINNINDYGLYYKKLSKLLIKKQKILQRNYSITKNQVMTNIIINDQDNKENIQPIELNIGPKFLHWNFMKMRIIG